MNGIIIVDKPKGFTSFDIVAKLRKKLSQRKIGHMGTLDPMATGVLPILLGDTAKFQIFANNNNKSYKAKIKFGITTDTLDITGQVLSTHRVDITKQDLKNVLYKFLGEIYQIPPMFSAIKKCGVKLYDLARNGVSVDREKRKIFIKDIKIINFDSENDEAEILVDCSKGTYIRTLCDDIGRALGCGATLSELRRTSSNGFDEKDSIALMEIIDMSLEDVFKKCVLPTERLFETFPTAYITPNQSIRFRNGGALMTERVKFDDIPQNDVIYKVRCNEEFIGLGKIDGMSHELKVLKCLK